MIYNPYSLYWIQQQKRRIYIREKQKEQKLKEKQQQPKI